MKHVEYQMGLRTILVYFRVQLVHTTFKGPPRRPLVERSFEDFFLCAVVPSYDEIKISFNYVKGLAFIL